MNRKPSQVEFTGFVPMDGDKVPLQKASEKKASVHKTKHGDVPPSPLLLKGGPSIGGSPTNSNSYRPPDWYQPPPMSPHMDSLSYISQDQFDSGIGSLENQLSEMWPSPSAGHSKHSHQEQLLMSNCRGQRPFYQPSPGPESNTYNPYQSQGYHKPMSTSDSGTSFSQYSPDLSHTRAARSFPGYSLPVDSNASLGPGRKCWSESYQSCPVAQREIPRAHHLAYSDSSQWAMPDRFAEERANVHVKLCGIFHPHLVDAVMNRFPQLLDPQRLAAEILTYKSQNPGV